jgi:hypothetical protein
MIGMESRREVSEPHTSGDEATSIAPRIVNGLCVRRREKVNVWVFGILFLPDVLTLFALVAFGVYRLLRYLDARETLVGRPDVRK